MNLRNIDSVGDPPPPPPSPYVLIDIRLSSIEAAIEGLTASVQQCMYGVAHTHYLLQSHPGLAMQMPTDEPSHQSTFLLPPAGHSLGYTVAVGERFSAFIRQGL